MPPRTAAVKALMPGMKPLKKKKTAPQRAVEDARRAGHGGADGEGGDDGAIDVDAHEGRGLLVLRDGTDGGADLGAHHEEVQEGHHHQRRAR